MRIMKRRRRLEQQPDEDDDDDAEEKQDQAAEDAGGDETDAAASDGDADDTHEDSDDPVPEDKTDDGDGDNDDKAGAVAHAAEGGDGDDDTADKAAEADDDDNDADDDEDDDAVANQVRQERVQQRHEHIQKHITGVDHIAKERDRVHAQHSPSHSIHKGGATPLMKAHVPGTPEFEQRQQDLLDRIKESRGRGHMQLVEKAMEQMKEQGGKAKDAIRQQQDEEDDGADEEGINKKRRQLPYFKRISKPRLGEQLPLIYRFVQMSREEELMLDATLSFSQGLRYGLFQESTSLNSYQKQVLSDWLELLQVSLPHEWAVHLLIDDLLKNLDSVVQSDAQLESVLQRHATPRTEWSYSCHSQRNGVPVKGSGFSCGFWKLLHISTVGVALHQGGINAVNAGTVHHKAKVLSPSQAADAMREYMAHFYPCSDCQRHFIQAYDTCLYGRCKRLVDKRVDASHTGARARVSDEEWKQLALWLWEFHNEVNVRLLHERNAKAVAGSYAAKLRQLKNGKDQQHATVQEEVQALWPRHDDCMTCYQNNGTWNPHGVFVYLEETYWRGAGGDHDSRLLHFDNGPPESTSLLLLLVWLLVLAGLVYGFFTRLTAARGTLFGSRVRTLRIQANRILTNAEPASGTSHLRSE